MGDIIGTAGADTLTGSANGGVTRISVDANGGQIATGQSTSFATLSDDRTKVAYWDSASDEVMVKDLVTGALTDLGHGINPDFSPDGTRVVYQVANGSDSQIWMTTLATGVKTQVSTSAGGVAANGYSNFPRFTNDGRGVAFESSATNLGATGDGSLFLKMLDTGAVGRVWGYRADATPDNRLLVFTSTASNLVAGDTNGAQDVFVRDIVHGTVTRVSVSASGAQANGAAGLFADISRDGARVLFLSAASNLVAGDVNGRTDLFVKDLATGEATRFEVTSASQNIQPGQFTFTPDALRVVLSSTDRGLVYGDHNGADIFVKNLVTGQMTRLMLPDGSEFNGDTRDFALSTDGTMVVFASTATNLVGDDTNGTRDVFIYQLGDHIEGREGDDVLSGLAGDDFLLGGAGADRIDGGVGWDTAAYSGLSTAANWTHNADGSWTVDAGSEGVDTLTGVEVLHFADRSVLLGPSHVVRSDFNGDGKSDVLWRNDSGELYVWNSQTGQGAFLGQTLGNPGAVWHVQAVGDYDGDGKADVLWRNTGGDLYVYRSDDASAVTFGGQSIAHVDPLWAVVPEAGDFDGDGRADILFRNTNTGEVYLWASNSGQDISFLGQSLGAVGNSWTIQAVDDFNGDRLADILWRSSAGDVYVWKSSSNNGVWETGQSISSVPNDWSIIGTGDFNGDGRADILWRHAGDGELYVWNSLMSGDTVNLAGQSLGIVGLDWSVAAIGDYDGDGRADILFRNADGRVYVWNSNDTGAVGFAGQGLGTTPTDWHILSDFHGM